MSCWYMRDTMSRRVYSILRSTMMLTICCRVWVFSRSEGFRLVVFGFLTHLGSPRLFAVPQEVPAKEQSPQPQSLSEMQHQAGNPTPLSVLIEEAKKNDPAIHVAETLATATTFA